MTRLLILGMDQEDALACAITDRRHRRYRSARELSPAEMAEFDEDCHRMNAEKNTAWSDS